MALRRIAVLIALVAGCDQTTTPPGIDYFDRVISPILTQSCARGAGGCHVPNASDPYAFTGGNFDVTSFETVHKRPDLLRTYGPYPVPTLLMKAVGESPVLDVSYRDRSLSLRIPHAGGSVFAVGSSAFATVEAWLANGATRDGRKPASGAVAGEGACPTTVPPDFDPTTVTSTAAWTAHSGDLDAAQDVIIRHGCAAANCHGVPSSDFYFTCGTDAASRAFNFRQLWAFVGDPIERSALLVVPTIGSSHSGGVQLSGPQDPDYKALETFAKDVGAMRFGEGDAGRTFFADHIMPILLRRGCSAEGCHSPGAMNDLKLRAGSPGFFSAIGLERNYDLVAREFMAFEAPDVRRSRLVAKNLLAEHGGAAHRGGPLLEYVGSDGSGAVGTVCPPFDPAAPERSSAYCTFVEWSRIERAAKGNLNGGTSIPLVYVERATTHVAGPLEFATYQPGSDLLVRTAQLDAAGGITVPGGAAARSLLDGCPGASDRKVVDVRGPDVKGDGVTVAFAMRVSAADTLHIYTARIDRPGECTQLTSGAGVHDFDPAWSPDGGLSIVFASTRAGGMTHRLGLPQSDIWRMKADGTGEGRMTFLTNSEISPQFMREGRIIMTTEKVDAFDPQNGFYQLSGRRLNWDNTDYHPLLAQRSRSPIDPAKPADTAPSIGYQQATEIREGLDGNFVLVLSDFGARAGGGTIGIFNRSIGPVELMRTDPGYLRSLTIPDPGAGGRTAVGAYRSPFMLLDGKILVSYAAGNRDMMAATDVDWDLAVLDPRTGKTTPLLTAPGAQVEAVLAIAAAPREMYLNRRQLVFGGGQDPNDLTHAFVYLTDVPMVGTLFGANLRRGRDVDALTGGNMLDIFASTGAKITSVPLLADGSVRLRVPAGLPVYIGLSKDTTPLFRMTEEHQFGPGEHISLGVRREVFNHVCGGCHGSVGGLETDVSVSADALTGASRSMAQGMTPILVGP